MNMLSEIIIPTLLAIIAYWLKRFIGRSDKRYDYFTEKIDELTINFAKLYEGHKNQNINCRERHIEIKEKLEDHEKRIQKLER